MERAHVESLLVYLDHSVDQLFANPMMEQRAEGVAEALVG